MAKYLILMLEYDEDDQYITVQYFRNNHPEIDIKIVPTSEDAIAYLNDCKNGKSKFPSILLLNYNSTSMNAVELTSLIKRDKSLSYIPVVILSGTIVPGIVKECYAQGASTFIQKPAMDGETNKKISSFIQYWFQTAELAQ
jgi:CheY-like chemotaxis protein